MRAAALGQPLAAGDVAGVEHGATATFPVKAADLPPHLEGLAIGAALQKLEKAWSAADFEPNTAELLSLL